MVEEKLIPQLRFSGFEDSWKTYRLKELLEKKSSNISINQLEDNSGDYPLYGASVIIHCMVQVDS